MMVSSTQQANRAPKKPLAAVVGLSLVLAAVGCQTGTSDVCAPGDQDGVIGGTYVFLLSVSDTGFAVGGVDSGSTEPNITVQNRAEVALTLTNTGTKPHGMTIQCVPTGLGAGCPATSCFPASANVPTVQPGQSVTTTFATPAVEGAYTFTSDEPGDTQAAADGGIIGLVGEFVLM